MTDSHVFHFFFVFFFIFLIIIAVIYHCTHVLNFYVFIQDFFSVGILFCYHYCWLYCTSTCTNAIYSATHFSCHSFYLFLTFCWKFLCSQEQLALLNDGRTYFCNFAVGAVDILFWTSILINRIVTNAMGKR